MLLRFIYDFELVQFEDLSKPLGTRSSSSLIIYMGMQTPMGDSNTKINFLSQY